MDIKSIYRRKQDDENYCWSKRRKVEVRLVGYFGFQYLANEPSSVLSSWSAIWVIGFVGICCAAFAKLGNAYFHFKVKVMLTVGKNRLHEFYDLLNFELESIIASVKISIFLFPITQDRFSTQTFSQSFFLAHFSKRCSEKNGFTHARV